MGNELKRVGLVFTQEGAVDFKKSLQEINIEMNKNYNQFKLTQAQWDNSTSSTEKLKAQQEYLTNAYEIQEDRVKTLRMQLSDLENAENKNTTAIKKKQNELTNAEIKLQNYKKQIQQVGEQLSNTGKKIEEFGTKLQNSGKKIKEAGNKVSAFSAATGAALVASAKSAIDFESAFTGVEKTVDGTKEQMSELKQGIREMAKEIPSSTTEISAVAEAAGQLGIKTDDILSFTRVMIDLGNATNLSAEEAASSLAKFANVTKMNAKDYDKLGATIVALGNNFATTEADIVSMATRLAATGELSGLSQAQILSLATAMSSVGVEAEAGGSAMSKLLKKVQVAVETGSQDLEKFASVAGMSTKDFKQAFEKDAISAISAFIGGLNDTKRNGKSAIVVLEDMGLKEVRLSNTILSLANSSDLLNRAVKLGNESWEDNTALANEANKRYNTLQSKIKIAGNRIKDVSITIGNKLMPTIDKLLTKGEQAVNGISKLNDGQIEMILKIGLVVTALGPLLKIMGSVTTVTGGTIKGIGIFTQALGVMSGNATTSSKAVASVASVLTNLASPLGIATIAVGALAGAWAVGQAQAYEASKEAREFTNAIEENIKAREEAIKTSEEEKNTTFAQMNQVRDLKDQLALLVDENGKVKDGYEARVKFILNELNTALGTEYTMTDKVISNYDKLKQSVEDLIMQKQIEAILEQEELRYNDALTKKSKAYEDMVAAQNKLAEAQERLMAAQDEYNKKYGQQDTSTFWGKLKAGFVVPTGAGDEIHKAEKDIENWNKAVQEATTFYQSCVDDTVKYSKDSTIALSNDIEAKKKLIEENTIAHKNSADDIAESTKLTIENYLYDLKMYEKYKKEAIKKNDEYATKFYDAQIQSNKKSLQEQANYLTSLASTTESMTPAQVEAWKKLATDAVDVYSSTISTLPPELAQQIQKMTGITVQSTPELVESAREMSQKLVDAMDQSPQYKSTALNNLRSFLNGLEDSDLRELLMYAGVQDVNQVMQGIRSGNLAESEGEQILRSLNNGLNDPNINKNLVNTVNKLSSKLSRLLNINGSVKIGGFNLKLPGFKGGLDYVPKDDFVARLHKGERVLTKEENEAYTSAEENVKTNHNVTNNMYGSNIDYAKMANAFLSALNKCKLSLDEDGMARFVQNEVYKVV